MTSTSVHGMILESIQTAVIQLITSNKIQGIATKDVVCVPAPSNGEKIVDTFPSIIICPWGVESIDETQSTNASDLISYPCLVATLDAGNQATDLQTLDIRLKWREEMFDLLMHNRAGVFSEVPRFNDSICDPQPIIDLAAWFEENLYLSAFIVTAEVLKRRRQAV